MMVIRRTAVNPERSATANRKVFLRNLNIKHRFHLVSTVLGIAAIGSTMFIALGQTRNVVNPTPSALDSPTSQEIVQRLIEHNQQRAAQLKSDTDERHYTVTYHGFPATLTASMVVDATYDAPVTKRFQIVSHSGSKLLFNRVLKRLLDSEKEAALEPDKTALTPANYNFSLLGQQTVNGLPCYVFHVDPKVNSKFLYRGKIFIDAKDYAVTDIDAEPAKNPSFWIKNTKIHHVYTKVGPFWLPKQNRSESSLRLGTAVLTIDYGAYRVQSAGSH